EDVDHASIALGLQLHVCLQVLDECVNRLEDQLLVLGTSASGEETSLVLHNLLDRNVSASILGASVHDVEREVGLQRVDIVARAELVVHLEVGGAGHDALRVFRRLDADVHLGGGSTT
ncbi:hypothetical protein PMAYCL1PPCAC_20994, partial [Pristionchus mayeri]